MVMLVDIPTKIFKCSLPVPHDTCLGWIFGTHEDFALKDFEQLLQETALKLAPNQTPLVQFGFNFKPIWNSSSWKSTRRTNHTLNGQSTSMQ